MQKIFLVIFYKPNKKIKQNTNINKNNYYKLIETIESYFISFHLNKTIELNFKWYCLIIIIIIIKIKYKTKLKNYISVCVCFFK